jgi:hypothetical protein
MFPKKSCFHISNFDILTRIRMKHEIFSVGSVAIVLNDISMDVALESKVVCIGGWGEGECVWQVL